MPGRPGGSVSPPHGIREVAVIGAGAMGHAIARRVARAGYPVVLQDTDLDALQRGLKRIRDRVEGEVRAGSTPARVGEETLARTSGVLDLAAAVGDADLVIESIPEVLEFKRRVFAAMERAARPTTILATNTASLSIEAIAEGMAHPERILGLHFLDPEMDGAPVEVVRTHRSSPVSVQRAAAFLQEIGGEAIPVRDTPGFATSRLQLALALEAMRMLEDGVATAEDLDRALVTAHGHPTGPLRMSDLIGLDRQLAMARTLHARIGGDRFAPPPILERMVREGRLGRRTGEGFFSWKES